VPLLCPLCSQPGVLRYLGYQPQAAQSAAYTIADGSLSRPTVWYCHACQHGWSTPTETDVIDWYTYAPRDETYLAEALGRRRTARHLIRRLQQYHSAATTILDVGSGPGFLVSEALQKGLDAHGLEVAKWAIAEARTICGEGRVKAGTLDSCTPISTDSITAIDVLEHVTDPLAFLQQCHQTLSPNGVLAIVTPRFDSLLARILRQRWYCIIPAHLQYFTRHSLEKTLRQAGFQTIRCHWHVRHFSLQYLLHRLGFTHVPWKTCIPVCLFDTLELYARRIDPKV
jgi:2-polyprenyl-3-methyl-5-hydroxy-6-metoxy-1,4-benzoquinol methylase